MATPLDMAGSLRARMGDPVRRLRAVPCLLPPRVIRRADITSMACMSRHITIVCCPDPVYISNVFNRDLDLRSSKFAAIELRRCYEEIYYDIAARR